METEKALSDKHFNMHEAEKYSGVDSKQIRELIAEGGLPGATVGQSSAEGYRIPKTALDAAVADGRLQPKPKRPYVKRTPAMVSKMPERMTIKEAAERFGIGYSTLQAKVYHGVIPSEEVQISPNGHRRYVSAADVAQLDIRKSASHKKRPTVTATPRTMPQPKPAVPETNLTSELLRAADMVRDGRYRVSKLVVALEFVGGE